MDIAIAESDLALMGGWLRGTLRVRRTEQVKLYFWVPSLQDDHRADSRLSRLADGMVKAQAGWPREWPAYLCCLWLWPYWANTRKNLKFAALQKIRAWHLLAGLRSLCLKKLRSYLLKIVLGFSLSSCGKQCLWLSIATNHLLGAPPNPGIRRKYSAAARSWNAFYVS